MDTRTSIVLLLAVLTTIITISHQQQCVTNLDAVFLMDGSNSMGKENFQRQMSTLINLINKLNVSANGIRVGVIVFSTRISASVNLTGDKDKLIQAIRGMTYPDEQTRTDLAIDEGRKMFDLFGRNGSVPQLLILVTDGESSSPPQTEVAATKAKAQGITIMCVGVTVNVNIAELNKAASEKNKGEYLVFVTKDFTTLEGTLNNATHRACVDLKCHNSMIDIAFVLDSSSSIGDLNFQSIRRFVYEFLLFADVDGGVIRVAIVTFSNTATIQFNLNTFSTKERMNSAINGINYMPGATNIADALKILRTTVFTRENGDRPDVPNVAILISANNINANVALATEEADATRATGIQIYGVGINYVGGSALLDGIVSRPLEDNRLMISSFSQLGTVVQDLYNKFNKFCETPPPVPACYMGITNIWFTVEVSRKAESLSRFQYTGDFNRLKTGLSKLLDIILDPSVSNTNVNTGLIAYSDTSSTLALISQANSVSATASAVQQLPRGIPQGGADLVAALRNIVVAPVVSNYRSYVAIVAPESTFMTNTQALEQEITRLKSLGYTITIFVIRENGLLNLENLQRVASGPNFFYNIDGYSELEMAGKNFTRDRLCNGRVDDKDLSSTSNLCAESGHRQAGVSVIPHPADCDKYVQCYYNQKDNLDLGVVRQCPMGLHWNSKNKTCSLPSQAGCLYDRCKEACEPAAISGSCRSYWDCESGVSTVKCCMENYAFVPGKGCQLNASCTEQCGPTKSCSNICQKKPIWDNRAGYDVMMLGGSVWMPRPCYYDNFNALDCGCTAQSDQVCPADRVYDFTDAQTVLATVGGSKEGIRAYEVQRSSNGILLGEKTAVHLNVNQRKDETDPFSLEFRFKETGSFSPYGEILISSGMSCNNGNNLLLIANDQFILAEVKSSGSRLAEVKVPTKGLNKDEFKTLVLSYNNGVLALSIKDSRTQYMAKTEGLSNICLACGLDIGRGVNKLSFSGEVQKIALYSCAWPLLY